MYKDRSSGSFSTCAVMQAITNCGPISRASLARQTGYTKQTISEIVRNLGEAGWVRETGYTSGHIGRSAVTFEVIPEAAYIYSVDLGGTKVHVSVADLACNIVAERVEATDPRGGIDVLRQIAQLCRKTVSDANIDHDKVSLAVVGVPGVPDLETGHVRMAPNIKGLDEIDVAEALENELAVKAIIENDVNLAALGEHWTGRGVDVFDMAFISVGTGIGAGLIVDGSLVRGADNAAGELGFLPLGTDPFEAESLTVGALERKAASKGIIDTYRRLSGSDEEMEIPEIFDRAAAGEKAALRTLDEIARALAMVVSTICSLTNPSLVVMGGSIGEREELVDRIRDLLGKCFPNPVEIIHTELGSVSTLVGGMMMGLTQLHTTLFADALPSVDITLPKPRMFGTGGSK